MPEASLEDEIEIFTSNKIDVGDGKFVGFWPSADPKRWSASYEGFMMAAIPNAFEEVIPTENGRVRVPKDAVVAKVDFMPDGKWEKDPQNTLPVLLRFFEATRTLLNFLDSRKGEIQLPQFYKNSGNPEMANFVKRFGFVETVRDKRIPSDHLTVLVKASDFREKLDEYMINESEMMEKRKARAERELQRKNNPSE